MVLSTDTRAPSGRDTHDDEPEAHDSRRTVIPPSDAPPLDWGDPGAVQRWLDAVREQALDAIAAGLDVTARRRRRVLSRAEARRQILDARNALEALLTHAGGAP